MSRLYDPQNPRMLTREEVARLSPADCAAACEELDQNILSTLQSIDANFVKTTEIVTDVLIPIVERYGRSSKHIWDSVKLWRAFFDASAGASAGADEDSYAEEVDYVDDNEEAGDTTAREQLQNGDEGDATAILRPSKPSKSKSRKPKRVSTTPSSSSSSSSEAEEQEDNNDPETSSAQHEFIVPPRRPGGAIEPSWADDTSPFEQLRQDIQKVRIDSSTYSTSSSSYHAPPFAPSSIAAAAAAQKKEQQERQQKQQTRLRDLSLDSPDFERPALQTMSFQHPRERLTQQYNAAPLYNPQDKGKGRAAYHDDDEEDNATVDASSSGTGPDTPAGLSTLSDLSSLGGPSGGDARPGMPRRKSSNNQNALLQKVLMKNLVGKDGRPNLSTPATKRMSKSISKARKSQAGQNAGGDHDDGEDVGFYPKDLSSDWNGLADLSKAPLSAFESPQKKSFNRHLDSQRSASRNRTATRTGLPPSMSTDSLFDNSIFRDETGIAAPGAGVADKYQPPPFSAYKSRLSRTPAKEAARLITRDVLQKATLREGGNWEDAGMDSPPLDPPSVVKNWATRGYTTHAQAAVPGSAPRLPDSNASRNQASAEGPSHRSQLLIPLAEGEDSFEAEFEDDEVGIQPPPQPNFGHLADEGDERGSQEGGMGGEASGQGDDWGDSFDDGHSGEDDHSGFDEPAEIPPHHDNHDPGAEEGDSFSDNSRSLDDETVFGAKRARPSHEQPGFGLHPADSLDPNSHQARLFRLQAQNDMVTLHGGNLLESQPFEASPLAGRDARYGL